MAQKLSQTGFEESHIHDRRHIYANSDQHGDLHGRRGLVGCLEEPLASDRFWVEFSEDPDEFKKRLINSPPPDYPQMARRAGIQGVVRLQVRAKTDGTLEVEKVIEGEPALVEAAMTALRQWRANPGICGNKVDVISTLAFNFQLR